MYRLKFLLFFTCLNYFAIKISAQGVGINSSGNAPNPSAGLDVDFNDRGMLTPRMSQAERDNIANPAEGLFLFNTDTKCFNVYKNSAWYEWCGTCTPQPTSSNAGADQLNINGSGTSLTGNTAIIGSGSWSIISGNGGSFSDNSDPSTTFSGVEGNSYELRWTITNACGSSFDQVIVSFAAPVTNYPNGNSAYWTERTLGFGDVTIGGGSTVFTYDSNLKQYKNGNSILLPNLIGTPDGQVVNATNFYGFSGGNVSENNFQWDGLNNIAVGQPSDFDVVNMFVSPAANTLMNYCQLLNINYSGSCDNSNSGSIVIDGPASTLAYPSHNPGQGTYVPSSGSEMINAGILKGSYDDMIAQQQLVAGANTSYCVQTYGSGWRLPTDVEMGHQDDTNFGETQEQIAYKGNYSGIGGAVRSSAESAVPSWQTSRWVIRGSGEGFHGQGIQDMRSVRCVYPGY